MSDEMSDQPASMRRVFEIEDDDKPAKRVVCFDPDDPEVIKRVTLSLYPAFISHPGFAVHAARAVLSVLKASG